MVDDSHHNLPFFLSTWHDLNKKCFISHHVSSEWNIGLTPFVKFFSVGVSLTRFVSFHFNFSSASASSSSAQQKKK